MNPGADRLPEEVLEILFSYLPCEDLVESVQFVCTTWQQAFRQMILWKHIMYMPGSRNENVAQRLKTLPQLRILNLIYATVDSDLIQFITDSCPNLEHLHLYWDLKYKNSDVRITRPMSQIKILSFSRYGGCSLDFPYLDRAFPNLESLNIGELCFDTWNLKQYLKKKQDSLHTLSLSCWTEEKLCVLPFLSVCTKLRNLSLFRVCDKDRSWEEVGYLPNISRLTLIDSNMYKVNDSSPVFCSFPNITVLVLDCCYASGNFFCTIARNCRRLQKLKLFSYATYYVDQELLIDDALHALPLERLTHLCIQESPYLTDKVIEHVLRLMPQLTHLDLYKCKQVTTGCLKLICRMSKLEVLKFDLRNQPVPARFRASFVKNKNLQLMFYNCQNVSSLTAMRKQHLRVCMTSYSVCWMLGSVHLNTTGGSWIKHGCLWCTNGRCSNSTHNET